MAGYPNDTDMTDTAGLGGWASGNDMIMDPPGDFHYSPMPQVIQQQSPYGPYHEPIQHDPRHTLQATSHELRAHLARLSTQRAGGRMVPSSSASDRALPSANTSMNALPPRGQQSYQQRSVSPRLYADVARLPFQQTQVRTSAEQTINPALLSQPLHNRAYPSPTLAPQYPAWMERFEQYQPQPERSNGQSMHLAPPTPVQARWARQYNRRKSGQGRTPRLPPHSNVPVQPDQLAYRLDMREEIPLYQRGPHQPSNRNFAFGAGQSGHTNRAELMGVWLGETKTPFEGMAGSPTNGPMSPASLRTRSSRAPSVASGRSEQSGTNRRIRKERQQKYRCDECHESFAKAEHLKKHTEHVHKGYEYRPYACAHCWKRWWYPKDLDRHQETHKPRDQRQGNHRCQNEGCEWSEKGFARKDGLKRHKATCSHSRADSGVAGIPMSRTNTTQTHSTRA